jgi:NTE family protein
MDKNYCLILAGGGTRGAYQVGAWKALQELGIVVSAVAGTSIGAINAAFILQGDSGKLERLYSDIDISDVIETSAEIGENRNLFNIGNIVKVARDYIKQKGFNNESLKELLEQNLDIAAIYRSSIDFGMVTYSVKNHRPLEIFRENILPEEFIQYLLASACFPIYKAQKIGENKFMDGGLYDNMPINMMIKKGYDRFIVVDISGPGLKRGLVKKDVNIKLIRPDESLGGIFEFNRDRLQKNMKMGYLDTLKAFCTLQGHRYYFKTKDFAGLLSRFTLQTIEGLEFAAHIYDMDRYRIYDTRSFLAELLERHRKAAEQYRAVKKPAGITRVIKEYAKIRSLISDDLVLCFFIDKIAEDPIFSGIGENLPFSDYISAARSVIELENSFSTQNSRRRRFRSLPNEN